jgi:PhoPQ-activated pathogenicity-related protein
MRKIFIVEVLVPDTFAKQDICIAVNIGIKKAAESAQHIDSNLSPMDYNTHILSEYKMP